MFDEIQQETLYDVASERLIISGILNHGDDAYYNVSTTVKNSDFYLPENRLIFGVMSKLFVESSVKQLDVTTIINCINKTDLELVRSYDLIEYLDSLHKTTILKENILLVAQKVAKLSLARNLKQRLLEAAASLNHITGSEKITEIISRAEQPTTTFTANILDENETTILSESLDLYLQNLAENKPSHRGIPSGFPIYDSVNGGGIRKPGVHLIGARMKVGKSFLCVNTAFNVTNLDIPVLYLDTEMTEEMTLGRLSALISKVPIDDIESGNFMKSPEQIKALQEASNKFKKNRFYYHNIAGKSHYEWISIIRKWIMKEVGFDADGNTKDCLVILDYIKVMDLGDMGNAAEHQYLGQVITDLNTLTLKYNFPILSMAQLNRDGINNSGEGTIADSDKLLRYCSSFSIFRKKTEEDYADDPPSNGNRKLEVVFSRSGKGLGDGEYINLFCDFAVAKIAEGQTNLQNRKKKMPVLRNTKTTVNEDDSNIDI